MTDPRPAVGATGEQLAATFLARHGLKVVARNVEVAGGELDILALDSGRRVAVEVRSITGPGEPLQAFGSDKAARVARLARLAGAERVDLVAIRLTPEAAEVRWVRGAA
ncbi:MAG TPA: YraN family protein [Acidimicrobiia bacterium]|nr:YraN family protein [Acidimicrobiia bacterium]